MADVKTLLVKINADTKNLNKGLKGAQQKVESFGDSVKKIGAIIGVAFGIREVLRFGTEVIKIAGILEGVEAAFSRIGDERILEDLRKATRGTVDDLELMRQAVLATNLGLDVKGLASLFELASRRAQGTGESVDYLVNSVVIGIGRKSIRVLDNLGITLDRLSPKLGGLGLESASVGQITAAVAEIAQEEFAKMGDTVVTTTDRIAQQKVSMTNLKIAVGQVITESSNFKDTLTSLNIILDFATNSINNFKNASDLTNKQLEKFTKILKIAALVGSPFLAWLKYSNKATQALDKTFKDTTKTFENTAVKQLPLLKEALDDTVAPIFNISLGIKDVNKEFDAMEEHLSIIAKEPGWGSITSDLAYGLEKIKTASELLRESLQYTFEDTLISALNVADQGIKAFLNSILQSLKRFVAQQIGMKIASALMNIIFPGSGTALGAIQKNWSGFAGRGTMPSFQHGGIVTQPTIGLIGEKGAEAVIPLGQNKSLNVNVVGKIRGEDIYWSNKNYEYNLSRTT